MLDQQTLDLIVREYAQSVTIADQLASRVEFRARARYHLEDSTCRLIASMRVPGQVLADHKLIAEYPATAWGYLARKLQISLRFAGWHKLADRIRWRAHQVFLDEFLAYPTVQIPPANRDKVRLMIATPTRTAWAGQPWEDTA